MLFSEPKIPQCRSALSSLVWVSVSVLFSEPKIPQSSSTSTQRVQSTAFQCSSASRKFLNRARSRANETRRSFQCSSASRKFLNHRDAHASGRLHNVSVLFSEPKIPQSGQRPRRLGRPLTFQCSSASRKFLNRAIAELTYEAIEGFSALQRAENSSIAPFVSNAALI